MNKLQQLDYITIIINMVESIYQLWLQHNPYKHRAMRIYGIHEELITGSKPAYEKFIAWATCFPSTVGNPLFHWSCMELKSLFEITDILTPSTAWQIWDKGNDLLKQEKVTALNIVKGFGVELPCTSDNLNDTLEHHIQLAKQQSELTCLPSLRADSIISFTQPSFATWLEKLQAIMSLNVVDLETYKAAIFNRLNFFDEKELLDDGSVKGFFHLNMDVFSSVIEVNTMGTVIPSFVFGRSMAKQKQGVIINIASMNSYRPLPKVGAYGIAKAGIANFTQWLAAYLAPANIRLNAIAPGFFLNVRSRKIMFNEDGSYTGRAKSVLSHTPMKRFGEAPESTGCLNWLIND